MGSKKFRKLQTEWYSKLEKTGFQDIEKNLYRYVEKEPELVRFHSEDFRQYTPKEFAEKEKYFQKAREFLEEDMFLNGTERRIWALHTMGFSLRKIVAVLESESVEIKANPSKKDTVNKVINEFQKIMFK